MMSADPQVIVLTERPAVRDDGVSELDVVVEVRCRKAASEPAPAAARKMNLCLVIDRSGSMGGRRLQTAQKSAVGIFRRLAREDLFTVVFFNHVAEVVVNPQTPRDEVPSRIEAISPGGATNLALGWGLGLLELQTT